MVVAVILSAGESSRMGRPKALLPIDGVRFVEKIVSTLKSTDVGNIIVVLGHNAAEMQQKISDLPVTILINHDYKLGQLSSLQAAIRHLESSCGPVDGMLVHLVDHPFIDAKLVNMMIDRFYETKRLIVVPRFQGRRGHPVIFARALFTELLAAETEQGEIGRAHV